MVLQVLMIIKNVHYLLHRHPIVQPMILPLRINVLKTTKKTNIPYETLLNDEDEDEEMTEQPTKLATESSTLLNKNLSQTYGTQSTTNERAKYLSNNGYNSHGSSITTKSSSDNSGSIRTNSGSDNDEESDEEHYNNSTASNNPSSISIYSHMHDSSIKSTNNKKSNDMRHANSSNERRARWIDMKMTSRVLLAEGNHYLFRRSNPSHPEQIVNKDAPLQQVPRFKQHPGDGMFCFSSFAIPCEEILFFLPRIVYV